MANYPPSGGKRPYYKRSSGNKQYIRKNERIRVPEVRVIDADGKQVGVISTKDAIQLAKSQGLDLVEVSSTSRPPVCRVLDFGKYKYDQSKKSKSSKPSSQKLKEVKFRLNTDQHDYMTKIRHAEEFLHKGNKLKLTLTFRGRREQEHTSRGFETINRAISDLESMGTPDATPKLIGRNITLTISPLPVAKRKPKFISPEKPESS
tara:strand:+ start:128 stop:742 length:615 start_codon:yes stop_codon:yes gene_type:complete